MFSERKKKRTHPSRSKPTLYSCSRLFHFLMIFEIGKGTLSSRSTTLGKKANKKTKRQRLMERKLRRRRKTHQNKVICSAQHSLMVSVCVSVCVKVKLNSRAIYNLQECRNDGKKLREAADKKRVGKILISGRLTCLCISCY